jgi:hypothetical protein
MYSGQGGAFRQIGPTKIAVFTVVNALGAVVDRQGNIVRCRKAPCGPIAARLAERVAKLTPSEPTTTPTHNTTVTLVATNQKLPVWALQRLAMQVHGSMARAIQPFNTTNDGDTLFAVSTGEIENEKLTVADLGVIASEVAWDAILSSVPELDSPDDRPVVRLDASVDRFAGEYEFAPGARATVRRDGDRLLIHAAKASMYLPAGDAELLPLSRTDYRIKGAREDRLRFDERGLVINPGHWPIPATRITPTR